jgi:hypothetical protein
MMENVNMAACGFDSGGVFLVVAPLVFKPNTLAASPAPGLFRFFYGAQTSVYYLCIDPWNLCFFNYGTTMMIGVHYQQ